MDRNDQQAIEGLFSKLGEAERAAPARDAEAESFITRAVAAQPGAPYYMAQTIVVQQAALEQAQARIEALESRPAPQSGGFLSSLFGGGAATQQPSRGTTRADGPATAALREQRGGGGGFLAGAAQTAVGVAGGVLLGNALAGMFAGDPAGELAAGAEEAVGDAEQAVTDEVGAFEEDFEI